MKTLFVTLLGLVSFICQGQVNNYNDWFDMGLKGKPKSVKEISIFPLNDLANPKSEIYKNKTVDEMLFIDEFQFDSLGLIFKEFHKNIFDTNGRWFDSKNKKIIQYKDSIIMIGLFPNGQESWRVKKILDKNGYVKSKTGGLFEKDTTIFKRDKNYRIIKEYSHTYSADAEYILKIENIYNGKGELISQKKYRKHLGAAFGKPVESEVPIDGDGIYELAFEFDKPIESEVVTEYFYIYDINNNWISRVSMNKGIVSLITTREIQY